MRNKEREEVYSTHYKDTQNQMCKGYLCLTTEIPLSSSLMSCSNISTRERERERERERGNFSPQIEPHTAKLCLTVVLKQF